MSEPVFSTIEIGLMTVAERRGAVRTPRTVDERNDPASIERLIVLRRLAERGFLVETPSADDGTPEVEFTMTETGRSALIQADKIRPPKQTS